uniref:Uncharacterized protein n=1 Tax=Siphoviridae sp. ctBCr48 TaxID=2827802 RepID=A0A8S5SI98_9CAUD|nr:MAG TPA: hypothetical protein [Siphoviridae sp. ctBCr48]
MNVVFTTLHKKQWKMYIYQCFIFVIPEGGIGQM